MDLVDEQHIIGFEIGQQRGKIAGALQHRAGSVAQIHAHLARDDLRQRGLAQAGRAEQQHMVERLLAPLGRFDEYLQLPADLFLADIFIKLPGTQRTLQRLLMCRGGCGRYYPAGLGARLDRKVIAVDHDRGCHSWSG